MRGESVLLLFSITSALCNEYSDLLSSIFADYNKYARPITSHRVPTQVDVMVTLEGLVNVVRFVFEIVVL